MEGRLPVVSGPVRNGKGWIFGSPIEDPTSSGFIMEQYARVIPGMQAEAAELVAALVASSRPANG